MSKHRKRRSRRSSSSSSSTSFAVKKKRSGIRTIIETIMGVSIALILIVFGVWYYFLEPPKKNLSPIAEKTMQDNVVDDQAGFETIRDSGILENQLNLLNKLDAWPRDAETPVRLDTLYKRLELAQVVNKRSDLDPEIRVSNAKRILNAMGQIYGIALLEEIDSDGKIVSDYLNVCNSFVNDENEDVAREARLAKAKVLVYESTSGEFDTSIDTIRENFMELIGLYPNNALVASTIKLLALQLEATDPQGSRQLLKDIIAKYDQQLVSETAVTGQLRTLKDEILLEESGIGQLAKEALETNSYDRYLEKLYELAEFPDTGMELISRIYMAIGHFERAGQNDIAISILERLRSTVKSRTDRAVREQAFRVSEFGLIRNRAVGKPFDFNDLDKDGNPIDLVQFQDRIVLLVFYSPNNPNTPTLLKNLSGTYNLISRTGVRIVAVAVEESKNTELPTNLHREWVAIQSSPPPGRTSEIFKRLPVTHVPYFAVVDNKGIVDRINVAESSIKTIIENMVVKSQSDLIGEDL